MSLQLILGGSGSGKSYQLYRTMVEDSIKNPATNYIAIVPEQFTMQTQKDIVTLHPNSGVLNIDILSFDRLAYRVFEEVGMNHLDVLDDTGKNLILRKVLGNEKEKLKVFKNKIGLAGFVDEMKSVLSEMLQYGIGSKELETMILSAKRKPLLQGKLRDIEIVKKSFETYLENKFITSEGLLDVLCSVIHNSDIIKNSQIAIDGFTGFTPIQYRLLSLLMVYANKVKVTITIPAKEADFSFCKEHELFHMSKDTVIKLSKLAKEQAVTQEKDIILTGTPYRFKENSALAFLEEHLFRYSSSAVCKGSSSVRLFAASNPLKEAEYVANCIYRLIREKGYRYRDIAVVTGDMENYYRHLSEVFKENEIPAFIDHKRNILNNPCVETIRSIVDLIQKDFSYESVFRYLKSGMNHIASEKIDFIENYVIAMGIRGFGRWNKNWERPCRQIKEDMLPEVNEIRQEIIEPLKKIRSAFKKKHATVKDFTIALYEFIVDEKMQDELEIYEKSFFAEGNLSLSKEYAQTYKYVIDLFDKIVGLLGDEIISLKEYNDILDAGFAEIKVGVIPPGIDEVMVGDIERTRLKEIKVLFFIGVNDGIIPKIDGSGGILSRSDRDFLHEASFELAPTAKENTLIQKFYLYLHLTKPSEKLYLSYSNTGNDGKTKRPSYLINTIESMYETPQRILSDAFEGIFGITNKEKAVNYVANEIRGYSMKDLSHVWKESFSILCSDDKYNESMKKIIDAAFYCSKDSKLDQAVAHVLYGEDEIKSITRLEKYAACAYSHFITYGLALAEREEHTIEASDIGSLYHNAIELVSAKIGSGEFDWRNLSNKDRNMLVKEAVAETVSKYENTALTSSARNAYMIRRLERVTDKTIWALSKHIESGRFEPAFYEYKLDKGRVDRVDLYDDGENIFVKIIDYKSGNKKFSIIDTYYGLQMQLMLYIGETVDTLQQIFPDKKVLPGAVFYYNVKDPYISKNVMSDESGKSNKYLREFQMSGLVNRRPGVIAALDQSIEETNDSDIIDVKLTSKGIHAKSSVADDTEFSQLIEYINDKTRAINQEIKEGSIDINPYKKGEFKPCDYCEYHSVCGFDTKLPGSEYRKLTNLKPNEVWEIISDMEE